MSSASRVARRHLAQMEKDAYLALPPVKASFGFEGPGADESAQAMALLVRQVMDATKKHSRHMWRAIAAELLRHEDVDASPAMSRVAASDGLRYLYLNLADEVADYFDGL